MASETLDPVVALILAARKNFAAFVSAVHSPRFIHSHFSFAVCRAVDEFVEDVIAGKRPILDLGAPPQFGKSSLISRCLPGYLIGRLAPELGQCRIALTSYAKERAAANLRDVKQIMMEPIYREVFGKASLLNYRSGSDRSDYLDHPFGFIKAQGAKGSLTGFSIDIALNDDLTKDAEAALSTTQQDAIEAWYDSVLSSRLQQRSGQVNIGTPWSAHDIMARINAKHRHKPTYKKLKFPALNDPADVGYVEEMPLGSLVPELHSEEKLRDIKHTIADSWWSALYQQAPLAEIGAIFGRGGLRYYQRKDLPTHFVQTVMSVDATFKGGVRSDYCFIGVWSKHADGRVFLRDYRREKIGFTKTIEAITAFKRAYPQVTKILIETAANGEAILDQLSAHVPGMIGVPALGSKEARAHAVSGHWQNGSVWLPSPDDVPGIVAVADEIAAFPDVSRNDDAVDGMVIALNYLMVRDPISSLITRDVLKMAGANFHR